MKIKDLYTLSSKPTKHNEDKIGFANNSVWLMDGATPMQKTIENDYGSDAAWLVNVLNNKLQENANLSIKQNLKKSLNIIREFYEENNVGNKELKEWKMPSAQFVGVEYNPLKTHIHLVHMGDTRILVKYKSGEVKVLGSTLLDKIDEWTLKAVKKIAKGNETTEERIELGKEIINKYRKQYMNQPNGFFTLTPSNKAFENKGIKFESIEQKKVDSILLATDGLLSIVEKYEQMSYKEMFKLIEKTSLEYVTCLIRKIEEEDSNCNKYFRFKKSDDTSGILLKF